MTRRLCITSDSWPEVTKRLHFVARIEYEGCRLRYEDIYFDDEPRILSGLRRLIETRRGKVALEGGDRFRLTVEARRSGGLTVTFQASSDAGFPGEVYLRGHVAVDGEYAQQVVEELIAIFQEKGEWIIEHPDRP